MQKGKASADELIASDFTRNRRSKGTRNQVTGPQGDRKYSL